jgi:membrane-anchored protein YejM (alkaline phosphatase superfamily)
MVSMNTPVRFAVLCAVAGLGVACSGSSAPPPAQPPAAPEVVVGAPPAHEQPQKVLLITVDTMRGDSLQCSDVPSRVTPNICALARKGMRYTRAISPAPATLPALTAIFTHSQVANEEPPTVVAHYSGLPTLTEKLRARGLQTAAFTDHHGLGHSPAVPVYPPELLQRGFDVFQNYGKDRHGQGAAQVTAGASAWLADHHQSPYFLWVHYFDPHFNYRPDTILAEQFGATQPGCGRVVNGMDITEIRTVEGGLTVDEVACLKALHLAELHATDAAIGRLLASLPPGDPPLIIFASDHGEEFRERDRIGHEWTVYNELIHVPFIVVGPGVPVGTEPRVVSTLEVHSVATGAPVALTGTAYSRTSHYYGKSPELSEVRQRPNEHALVTDHEKVILHPDGRAERFHLDTDPGERQLLPEVEPLLTQLRARIDDLTVTASSPSASAAEEDRAARERLRDLGYVE